MQIPSVDPTVYCRLCFTQHQLGWLLQSSDNPMVAQIQTCLGVALISDADFPCAVCRLCSTTLETLEAFRERAEICDAILRNSRVEGSTSTESNIIEFKQECHSPEPELLIEQVIPSSADDAKANADCLNGNNTIMVGDIKVELLNVRPECKTSIKDKTKYNPRKTRLLECNICKQTFVNQCKLLNHNLTKHSSNNPGGFAAALAANRLRHPENEPGDFKPISPKEIRKEMNMNTGSKKPPYYYCNKCNAQFRQWQPFMRHRKSHLNEKGAAQTKSK